MAIHPTVILTFILLFLMTGAGLASGMWGYTLGRQALRGITQPDGRPNSQFGRANPNTDLMANESMFFLDEGKLIENVKTRISGSSSAPPSPTPTPASSPPASAAAEPAAFVESTEYYAEPEPGFAPSEDPAMEQTSWQTEDEVAGDGALQGEQESAGVADPFFESEPFLDTDAESAGEP
jgi:hypothetical protein